MSIDVPTEFTWVPGRGPRKEHSTPPLPDRGELGGRDHSPRISGWYKVPPVLRDGFPRTTNHLATATVRRTAFEGSADRVFLTRVERYPLVRVCRPLVDTIPESECLTCHVSYPGLGTGTGRTGSRVEEWSFQSLLQEVVVEGQSELQPRHVQPQLLLLPLPLLLLPQPQHLDDLVKPQRVRHRDRHPPSLRLACDSGAGGRGPGLFPSPTGPP